MELENTAEDDVEEEQDYLLLPKVERTVEWMLRGSLESDAAEERGKERVSRVEIKGRERGGVESSEDLGEGEKIVENDQSPSTATISLVGPRLTKRFEQRLEEISGQVKGVTGSRVKIKGIKVLEMDFGLEWDIHVQLKARRWKCGEEGEWHEFTHKESPYPPGNGISQALESRFLVPENEAECSYFRPMGPFS